MTRFKEKYCDELYKKSKKEDTNKNKSKFISRFNYDIGMSKNEILQNSTDLNNDIDFVEKK